MASRSRRARYAAPIVITFAAAGCAPQPEPVHANPPGPEPVHHNPPPIAPHNNPPEPEPKPEPRPIAVNPPPTRLEENLPAASPNGRVEKQADGSCIEYFHVECPANVRCNPPPPRKVRCP